MIKKSVFLCLVGFLACSSALRAQEPDNGGNSQGGENAGEQDKAGDAPGPNRFWQANVGGGTFMVALDKIVSISRHKYVLDGALVVDEVTVDTAGQALARFYFATPVTDSVPGNTVKNLADTGRELIDGATQKTGMDIQNMVVKTYPVTTHAKSLEYRIDSEAELKSLYASVQNAWESNRGRKFTAK